MAVNFSKTEEEILEFWEKNKIFEKTLNKPAPKGDYVFYDGPPFATGLPHYGHILASTIKDLIPRYKTMCGYHVRRRWGWDCHGLPIENIVEQQLGISGKKQIEERGIGVFNQACRDGVLKYAGEWGKMVRRIARWVEFDNSYKTMDNSYMESVWWALKQIWDKKLIYEGRKVLLYCPRCETPISNFEVAMDNSYSDVTEEAVTIKFPISLPHRQAGNFQFPNTYFLAWTTTPWTLPGNMALAVGEEIDYVVVRVKDEQFIIAKARLSTLGEGYEITSEMKGKDLVGLSYEPLFKISGLKSTKAFKVYPADFVTTDEGTGIVHTAVVYGEDDYNLGLKYKLPIVPLLDEKGVFNEQAPELIRGQYFKNSEKVIKQDLEDRGLLLKREMNTHSYPHCWRCNTKLFYNAIPAWFIKISKIKNKLFKLNEKINWYPEHLKHGRFQKGIEGAPDWNISRNRYWATPLPFWRCESNFDHRICIGSFDELKQRAVNFDEVYKSRELKEIDLHRPYIDDIKIKCDECGGEMRRIPEVIDCWVESASMPFAEFHYPFENNEVFKKRYPADFVAEYIAQTRAWFYVTHVIGTAVFGKPPFKNVVTTGTIVNEKGEKLSKSKRNFPDPWEVVSKYGADSLRFYMMTSPVMQADNLFFSEREVDGIYKKVVLLATNVLSFYKLYAPTADYEPKTVSSKHILDRWIVARLHETIRDMTEAMDKYDVVRAGRLLPSFIDDLSTWYLRRSRERFKSGKKRDCQSALLTTHYSLLTSSKLLAPFMPFLAEHIYQGLGARDQVPVSVHLEDWPKFKKTKIDEKLIEKMALLRNIISLALEQRAKVGIPVRQVLQSVKIFLPPHQNATGVNPLINSSGTQRTDHPKATGIILWCGGLPSIKEGDLLMDFKSPAWIDLVMAELNVKEVYWEVGKGDAIVAELDTTITEDLKKEGMARELVRRINGLRKEAGLRPSDLVEIIMTTVDPLLREVVKDFQKELRQSVIAQKITVIESPQSVEWSCEFETETHEKVWIGMRRV